MHNQLEEIPEKAYGRAVLAFILVMMVAVSGTFGLMALGLWQGIKVTW